LIVHITEDNIETSSRHILMPGKNHRTAQCNSCEFPVMSLVLLRCFDSLAECRRLRITNAAWPCNHAASRGASDRRFRIDMLLSEARWRCPRRGTATKRGFQLLPM